MRAGLGTADPPSCLPSRLPSLAPPALSAILRSQTQSLKTGAGKAGEGPGAIHKMPQAAGGGLATALARQGPVFWLFLGHCGSTRRREGPVFRAGDPPPPSSRSLGATVRGQGMQSGSEVGSGSGSGLDRR